jgi:polyphosphate kinase
VDPALTARLEEILTVGLADDVLAWELGPDGSWSKVATSVGLDSQTRLEELAEERARSER